MLVFFYYGVTYYMGSEEFQENVISARFLNGLSKGREQPTKGVLESFLVDMMRYSKVCGQAIFKDSETFMTKLIKVRVGFSSIPPSI